MRSVPFAAFIAVCLLFHAVPAFARRDSSLPVRILRADGTEIRSFSLPTADSVGGATVAVGDLGTDGVPEIVVANGLGNEPLVHLLRQDGSEISSFLAYDKGFGFGVNVAMCDLDGDGVNEIITTPQRGGGPHLRVFSNAGKPLWSAWAYAQDMHAGVNLACRAFPSGSILATLPSMGGANDLRLWRLDTKTRVLTLLDRSSATETNTMRTAIAQLNTFVLSDLDRDGTMERVEVPTKPIFDETQAKQAKSIVVDISEQRLYAYENGILANTFLVSTGRAPYKTPLGERTVMEKVLHVRYAGGVGKYAYDLGVVKYNLRFAPRYYIHYAPWHDNFGTPMSHGCVNVRLDRMKWIYDWSEKNIPVTVRE